MQGSQRRIFLCFLVALTDGKYAKVLSIGILQVPLHKELLPVLRTVTDIKAFRWTG